MNKKFCSHCGKEVAPQAVICVSCGCQLEEKKAVVNSSKNNSMAVGGFISAIISLFINFFGIVGIVATVLSAIGLNQISATKEKGKGLAIAGLCIGIFSIIYGLYQIMILASW